MRIDFSKFGNIRDQLITVAVLIIALVLMTARQDNAFNNVRKASITLVSILETPLSTVRVYRTALQTNAELERQNILLQDQVSRLRSLDAENRELRRLLAMQDNSEYDMVPVRIVAKNLSGINNNIIINAGEADGVQTGMPVLNADGLIGTVTFTGNRFSQVLPVLNRQFRASVVIEDSRAFGIVSWESTGLIELVLRYVPQTIEVAPGMLVKTSGLSMQFPHGIPVGRVTRTEPEPGKETQIIYLDTFVSFYTVAEAHVLLYQPDDEIEELQQAWNRLYQ
jgi:rod shape-determining protein MreC